MTTTAIVLDDVSGKFVTDEILEPLTSIRAQIAEMRRCAQELANKGTPESRMRARVLRSRATKGDHWIEGFLDYFGTLEPDGEPMEAGRWVR